ncbi:hypothetical protein PN417_10010 [Halorubrum ezzemoulense]|uniref:hypothetical protein n=1 Tax=Halorubrum ezzemoulense TaxID=337243 RepID=UPI00232BC161|nr:hypothetical protein [Halorubrum ezzemoulense]MDB9301269.1 hypothetical protein [Halorubrum ezzemoulense]
MATRYIHPPEVVERPLTDYWAVKIVSALVFMAAAGGLWNLSNPGEVLTTLQFPGTVGLVLLMSHQFAEAGVVSKRMDSLDEVSA